MIFKDLVFWQTLSIFLTAAGLFQIFGKFYDDKLNLSYYGYSPFQIKKHCIDKTIERVFIFIVLLGFFIQALVYALPTQTLSRKYDFSHYLLMMLFMIIFSSIIVIFFTYLSKLIAKKLWFPKLLKLQKDIFLNLDIEDEKIEKNVDQLETLFEIKYNNKLNISERIYRLRSFYDNHKNLVD